MYRVFENSGECFEFSDGSANDFAQFLTELARVCHTHAKASASEILCFASDGDGKTDPVWLNTMGEESQLLDTLEPVDFLKTRMELSLEKATEFCLRHCPESGFVEPLSAAAMVPADAIQQPESSGSIPFHVLSASTTGSSADTKCDEKTSLDSIVWLRPISNQHVLISICPASSLGKPLLHVIRNAYELRQGLVDKLEAERNYNESRRLLRLAEEVSEKLPLEEQAHVQANEIRSFLGCDRVTVFDINNSSATAIAVSGQPKFNRRSNSIRTGKNMVGKIAKTGEPFWFTGNFDDLADSMKESVRSYTDESLVNSFAVLPLNQTIKPVFPSEEEATLEAINPGSASKQKTIGAILVEQIENVIERKTVEQDWSQIQPFVLNQYSLSRQYDSIFLIRFWTMLGRFAALYRGQTKRKAILITSLIGLLLLASIIIPSDFKIRCEGYLVFENTVDLYTRGEGEVTNLDAFDGKKVKKGDVLLVVENLSLKKELMKLTGEVASKEIEIADLNDARSREFFSRTNSLEDVPAEIAQEVSRLEVELLELKTRSRLMEQELEHLVIRAPFDGTVAGWKTERRLLGRPLERGVYLFSVIPSNSSFRLELRVPDQRAGYVQAAWQRATEEDENLPVTFRLASAPGTDRKAHVSFVSPGLERDEHIGYTLPIHAMAIEAIPESERKSKTAVLAKVICGRHSFAYCKCYEAVDWVRSKWFEFSF